MKNTELFYSELGKLLYAVAMVDGNINPNERKVLSEMISQRLLQKEDDKDEFGTNEAWFTLFSFDTTEDQMLSAEEAYETFIDYCNQYKYDITDEEISQCLKLSNVLADSYRDINNKENKLLNKLRNHLLNLQASQLIF
jgi:uncharacterized protein YpuA (DUF1002 family)